VRMADIARAAGLSRQAVYLHFPTRAELLIALTRQMDAENDVDARLAESRAAQGGEARLAAFVAAWAGYIPEIHGVAKALMAMAEADAEARAAWEDRMTALRAGCAAAVAAIAREGALCEGLGEPAATDLLWSILSIRVWEHLRIDCGWTQEAYAAEIARLAFSRSSRARTLSPCACRLSDRASVSAAGPMAPAPRASSGPSSCAS
jgi:AcrR family transcriptional regulator